MTSCSSRLRVALSGAVAAVLCAIGAGQAQATVIGGTVVLPNAVSYEYFGVNFADNIVTSNTVGTLDYAGHPGCGGVCMATTQLGSSPSVSVTMNEVEFAATSGGVVQADLGYYVEYLNKPGTYNVNLHAIDSLSGPDGAPISAHLKLGEAGTNTTSFNNFVSTAFEEADCVNRCPSPGFVISTSPFVADNTVQMVANTPYFVQLDLLFNPGPSNVQIAGLIDPTFSDNSQGGTFVFSPGVIGAGSAVPEPGVWLLMLGGLFAIGGVLRRKERLGPSRADSLLATR